MAFINTCQQQGIEETGVIHIIAQPPITDKLAEIPAREGAIELLIDGIVDGTCGFSNHIRDWARHFVKYGVRVFIPQHRNTEYPEIAKLHDTKVSNPIELLIYPGGGFHPKNPDRFIIGYAVFETNEYPTHFRDDAENVDLVWTASKYSYDRLVRVGIPKNKIEIYPEGVDVELFNPYVQPSLKKEGVFRFSSVMGWSARKGIHILLNAYLKEFSRNEGVVLYVSGGWYAKANAEKEVKQIKEAIGGSGFPKIELDWSNRLDWEMPSLFNSFDCFCLPSLGEGYGRPIVEALSCAVPTIVTNYPPMNEIVNKSNGYLIQVEKVAPEPACDWICDDYKGEDFAHPSEEHLRALMREVFEHQDEAKAKAIKGREDIKKNHNVAFVIEDVIKRLVEIKERYY